MFVQQSDQNWVYFTLKDNFNTATSRQRHAARASSIALPGSREMLSPGVEEKQLEKKFFLSLSKFFLFMSYSSNVFQGLFFLDGYVRLKHKAMFNLWPLAFHVVQVLPCHSSNNITTGFQETKSFIVSLSHASESQSNYTERLPVFHCPDNWFQNWQALRCRCDRIQFQVQIKMRVMVRWFHLSG